MIFFKGKNKTDEYKSLKEYKDYIEKLLNYDKYISRKEYVNFYNKYNEVYSKLNLMEKEDVLFSWCKKNKTNYNELKELISFYSSTEENINKSNENFIERHLDSDRYYLDDILKEDDKNILLDEEQRKVVLSDEDYTLVIAGAGSGKTTTIEAKVKYLIEKNHISSDRILIISFTKKATNELQQRFNRLKLPVKISTFHSIANSIITNESFHHNIATGGFMFSSVKKYFLTNSNDEIFVKKALLFFASYLQVPVGEDNIAVLFNELSKNDCTTLKSDISQILNDYKVSQERKHITIKNETVRSLQECRIANFLFINGIDYVYEPVYEYGFDNTSKPYCPDFYITQFDKKIYLEHFGISENGKNCRFSESELLKYKKHVNDKILLHKKHGTKLIYTFSKYNDGRSVISHLKEELQKNGISLEPKNSKEIYKAIISTAEDKYFNKFIQFICVFISRFKTNNFSLSKFDEWKLSVKDERTKLFIDICYQCYLAYMADLKNSKSIDFEDMINNASDILNKMIENNEKLPYDYIFVDEYQDISMQRFDLCERLSKCSNAKIVAVGDDWQSIFKFSGARIELFTKFRDLMGYANVLKITSTYRNSQELIDIAGNFVMENDEQIKKNLNSKKRIDNPIVLYTYDDSYEKDDKGFGYKERFAKSLQSSLDELVSEFGNEQKVLIIGRYGFDGFFLGNLGENYFSYSNGVVKSIKYPKLKITYLTAHASKGLGYDNVIIINAKDAIFGFPSKIEDDPIMKLVIKENENFSFSEERRLFYVALTRTKNKVHIITPKYKPSQFILELKQKYNNILLIGEDLEPIKEMNNILKCPYCGYPLQKRMNKNLSVKGKLWICSNDPEICGFMTNDISGGKLCISKCPKCEDGYLIVKTIKTKSGNEQKMLGCSNFKIDGTGCSTYMMSFNYTQDLEKLNVMFYDEKTDMSKVMYCGHLFKDVVDSIVKEIKKYKSLSFSLGTRMLFSIMSGTMTKSVEIFKLYNDPMFGYIKESDRLKFYKLITAMIDEKVIFVDKNNFGKLILLKDNPTEKDYKIIYASLKF